MKLLTDLKGDVKTVSTAVGILITLIIAILVFYNVASGVDVSDVDERLGDAVGYNGSSVTHATNSSDDILAQGATFFQIAPIIVIVLVAVVILRYVGMI